MVHEAIPLDVSELPELRAFAERVNRSGARYELRSGGEALATVAPAASRRHREGKRTSADDPIWDIVGMAQSAELSDVSAHVDDYLTAAEFDASHA